MSKERFLTVLIPIKDSDCDPTEYGDLSALQTAVPASAANIDVIYRVKSGIYYRSYFNGVSYAYHAVVDREFPFLGEPLEIYDFTYDATRMGTAPTITAQGVKWYADKEGGEDVTLDGLWTQKCHVVFNGKKLYLKNIPSSSKDNEDARYKYDLDFVDETVVLERVYFYDIVQPFINEKPVSESTNFSFYGDINEFARRINANLIRSGLASLVRKYVYYSGYPKIVPYLSYEQWNEFNVDPVSLYPSVFEGEDEMMAFYQIYSEECHGDYNIYLMNYIYENVDGVYTLHGYQCIISKDKYGQTSTSEEKLLTFEQEYIHDVLQQFHDTFELQYYITMEKDGNGDFTGNIFIVVGDCEFDFADWDSSNDDYVRDEEGIPTTESPFDYGIGNEFLSKGKDNTTEKIVSRITGVGSSENVPWYYPNPNPDGWIRPMFTRNGEQMQSVDVGYPVDEGSTAEDYVRYEKYLKNRIGVAIKKGAVKDVIFASSYDSIKTKYVMFTSPYRDTVYEVTYKIVTSSMEPPAPVIMLELDCNPTQSACDKIHAELTRGNVTVGVYDSESTYANPTDFQSLFLYPDGTHRMNIAGGHLYLLKIYYRVPHGSSPAPFYQHEGYRYAAQTMNYPEQLPSDYEEGGRTHHYVSASAYIGENFYQYENLSPYAVWEEEIMDDPNAPMVIHAMMPTESGFSTDGTAENAVSPIERRKGDWYKDLTSLVIYECNTNVINNPLDGYPSDVFTENPTMSAANWLKNFVSMQLYVWGNDGWYIGDDQIQLEDYGLDAPTQNGSAIQTYIGDAIEFQRVKWVTPQPKLMPEVFIKTDGERRFYDAHNYWDAENETLFVGVADSAVGEVQVSDKVRNPIYKENETDADNEHYEFESEYVKEMPYEHIENFDDIKPTIKGQTNTIKDSVIRIDVVETFEYDLTDNDEIWEDSENGSIQGEYKHPYFFAKLRPMGFNIFDMALQDDMVISMTTGNCGACNFKIGVDENSKKNPVQLWEYDVYRGEDLSPANLLYEAGTLRRYVNLTGLYYDTPSGAVSVVDTEGILEGDHPLDYASSVNMYQMYNYTAEAVKNGYVGTMKQRGALHFEGDVVTDGKFIESQQDTTENYVWIALMKDTESYGTLMPSSRPDYNDAALCQYIRPKSITDVHVTADPSQGISESTNEEDEEKADKFVITNIRMPQIYLRRAEHELSRKLVAYMYEHNYQKFNFSIKFSRIYIEDNPQTDDNLNENSVLYVRYDRRTYRQYVKHYTYKMSHDAALPEVNVDMNEELSVTKTISQQWDSKGRKDGKKLMAGVNSLMSQMQGKIDRTTIKKDGTYMFSGNIIVDGENTSLIEIARRGSGQGGGDVDIEAIPNEEIDDICV